MNKQQGFLLAVLVASLVVSLLLVLPSLQYVLAAVIVACVLSPVNERIQPYLGPRWAPLVTVSTALIAVVLPLSYITLVLIGSLQTIARGGAEVEAAEIESTIREFTGEEVDLGESISALGSELLSILFGNVTQVVSASLQVSIGAALRCFWCTTFSGTAHSSSSG